MFPDIQFDYKWADEDFGYNTGKAQYQGDKTLDYFLPLSGSTEALDACHRSCQQQTFSEVSKDLWKIHSKKLKFHVSLCKYL